MMTPNEIDKMQKECEYEAMKDKVEELSQKTREYSINKDTITISMEEYKELLIIKGKYEELSKIRQPLIVYDGYKENGTTIMPM